MKIDLNDYLTPQQAADAIGCNKRAMYRAAARAKAAGHENLTANVLGRPVVLRSAIPVLKQFYYPYYSETHQRMVTVWGASGGRASGESKKRRKAAPKSPQRPS